MTIAVSFADLRRAAGIATSSLVPIVLRAPGPPRRERLCPLLTAADEGNLVLRYLCGERSAGDRLLRAHDKVIRSRACRLARRCSLLDENDLMQAGRLGFLNALRTFDPDGDGTLAAYAGTAAFRAMMDLMDEQDDTIKIGVHQRQAIRRALKGGGLSAKLAAIDGLRRMESIDEPAADDDDRTLLDCLSRGGTPEDALIALEEINGRATSPQWRPRGNRDSQEETYVQDMRIRGASYRHVRPMGQ